MIRLYKIKTIYPHLFIDSMNIRSNVMNYYSSQAIKL